MRRAPALAVVALAAALAQGCSREPVRTVVRSGQQQAAKAQQPVAPPPAPAASAPSQAVPPAAPASPGDGAALLAQRQLVVPVVGIAPSSLTDQYQLARGQRVHEAIDIMAPTGTPVVAVDDGTVAKLFTSKGGGGLTIYQFDTQGQLAYYYAHLDSYAEGVREGMALRRGQLIGYVGSTGNANPAAPHLHFAVFRLGPERRWWEGEAVNPYPALSRAPAAEMVAGR